MKTIFAIFFAFVIFSESAVSQIVKRIRRDDIIVTVRVNVMNLPDGYFRYSYFFENSQMSHQTMSSATVELGDNWVEYGGTLRNVIPPKEKDWGQFPSVGRKMWWNAQYDTTGKDDLRRVPISAILPGEHLSFSFECKGLPTIGHFWAAGWAPWFFTEGERDSLIAEGYPEEELHDTDDKALKGRTVVPKFPPSPFICIVFLDTLISYKHHADTLGWLADDNFVNELDNGLNNARKHLVKGDSVNCAKELQTFQDKVQKEYEKTQHDEKNNKPRDKRFVTSEGYALLYFNTQYLLDRLPKKK